MCWGEGIGILLCAQRLYYGKDQLDCPPPKGPPGVLGIWGKWLFIFRELGSTVNYFQVCGKQANIFGDLGSPVKKKLKNLSLKEKPSFRLTFSKKSSAWGSGKPPDPPSISKCIYFRPYMLVWIGIGD